MGDFNGRIGSRREPWVKYFGPHSDTEKECNYNGEQILNLCAEFDLYITNTFYQHRKSQMYTWYKWNDLNIATQFDFILVKLKQRKLVTDSRAIPNAGLDTDHRPVILTTCRKEKRKNKKRNNVQTINTKQLENEDIKFEVQRSVESQLQQYNIDEMSLDQTWDVFKEVIGKTLEDKCGTRKSNNNNRKATPWWNQQVKSAVEEKKKAFKKWYQTRNNEDYEIYKIARKSCAKIIKESTEKSYKKYGEELSELCKTSLREFYKKVNAMRKRDEPFNPTAVINDKEGNPLYDKKEINNRWEEYFKDLLNPPKEHQNEEDFVSKNPNHIEPQILESEVRKAIKLSPKNKAAGVDGITTETILACGEIGVKWLKIIFNKAWEERKTPLDWQKAIIVPIWKKKGSKSDCTKYRGISLLSHVGKMYAKIIEQRTRAKVERYLSKAQFGFRKGKGCTDAIFSLRQLSEKAIEFNTELNVLFVDQEKAFDRVDRKKLWKILEKYDVKGQLLDNIRAMYTNSLCAVRTTTGYTKWFEIKSGVRQGCVLSPLLFIIYMDEITKRANPNIENINELLFADDQGLINEDEDELQRHANSLNTECQNHNMKISISKTEAMHISKTSKDIKIKINNEEIKQTNEFKYLGCMFTEDGKLNREIEIRVQKANAVNYQLTPILKNPYIPTETKAKIIKSTFVPTLMNQCQTWTLNKKIRQKITTCEMRCLRKAVNKTRRDRIRNEDIRKMLNISSAIDFAEKQTIKWFEHLMRMNPEELPSRTYNRRSSNTRERGRPPKRWIDGVREILGNHGLTTHQATRMAQNRQRALPSTSKGRRGRKK